MGEALIALGVWGVLYGLKLWCIEADERSLKLHKRHEDISEPWKHPPEDEDDAEKN